MEQPFPSSYPPGPPPGPPPAGPSYQLRSFGVGAVLGQGFSILFRRLHVFLVMLVVTFAPLWIYGAVRGEGHTFEATGPGSIEIRAEGWVMFALSLMLYAVLAVAVTYAVVEEMSGRRASIGKSLSVGLARMFPLLLLILLLIVICFGVVIVAGIIGYGLAQIAPFLGILAIYAILFWFYCCMFVVVPTLAIERNGVFGAISRALFLTRGNRWRIFGLLVVLFVIMLAAAFAAGAIVGAQGETTDSTLFVVVIMGIYLLAFLGNAVFTAVSYALLRNDKDGVGVGELASVFE